MIDFSESNQQRDFYCEHCNGRIARPFALPPTTGPCPHCQVTITSPPPEPKAQERSPFAAPAQPIPATIPELVSEPASAPSAPPINAAQKEEVELAKLQPVLLSEIQTKRSSGIIPVGLVLLFLILAGGGAMYYFLSQQKHAGSEPPKQAARPKAQGISDPDYVRIGWQAEAFRTLTAFMEGTDLKAKLPHIRDAESLRARMDLFYGSKAINDGGTPSTSFHVRELPPEIHKRGIFMLSYEQPAGVTSAVTGKPVRVYALFKWTKEGLKLDWEVFAQTKYRTLRKFAGQPKIGARETFRVLIAENEPPKGYVGTEFRTYLIKDPANLDDLARVNVKADSANGKELAAINWRGTKQGKPIIRTATVELEWVGSPDKPVLSMRRFICWEFLGLGGTENPATAIPD
jgi:hypothetical protein